MNIKRSLLIALFCCFTLFGFAPLEIYFSIYEDVWFGFEHIISLVLLLFFTSFFCLFVFLTALTKVNEKWSEYIDTLLFAVVMSAYVQGNFLPSAFGSMDGQSVDWSAYGVENVLSIALWFMVISVSFWLLHAIGKEKFFAGIKIIMICVLLVQTVTLVTVCITTEGLKTKNSAAFLDRNQFSFSKEKNVIVLVLDMYDSQVFKAICEEEGNEEYLEPLDGFTYYPDTVGAYSSTYSAIPHILTGEKYFNNKPLNEYINEAYVDSPLLADLVENKYEVNIYTNEAIPTEKMSYEFINNYLPQEESNMEITSKKKMIMYMGKLVGIRYLPQPLKRFCWFYSAELWDVKGVKYQDELYSLDNFIFNDRISEANAEAIGNTFHFYHVEGAHPPCYYDENLNKIDTNLSLQGQEGMIRNGKGMLVLVRNLLQELKDLGIYDNCAIVVMADHGGGFSEGDRSVGLDRANPLLLVKGFEEKHSLEISDMRLSYDDLQDAFQRLLDGYGGEHIFADAIGKNENRYYISLSNWQEYVTDGYASDASKLKQTGVVYGKQYINPD